MSLLLLRPQFARSIVFKFLQREMSHGGLLAPKALQLFKFSSIQVLSNSATASR